MGLGRKIGITLEALIDTTKSLNEGAVIAPGLADMGKRSVCAVLASSTTTRR